jgi:hypothetical protein
MDADRRCHPELLLLLKRVTCVHHATHRARLSSSTFLTGQATNLSVSPVVVGSHSNIIPLLSQTNDVLLASQNRWKKENY